MTSQLLAEFHDFYVQYKAAWSNNSIEQMQQMISPSLQAREITGDLEIIDFGYEGSIEGWKQGFAYFAERDMEWMFKDVTVMPLRDHEVTAIFWVWYFMDGVESKTAHLYVQTFRKDTLSSGWKVVRSYIEASVPRDGLEEACDHLVGLAMPPIELKSTANRTVNLAMLGEGRTVLYCYPLSGRPGEETRAGWDQIPGAKGCTAQACSFRDHKREFTDLGVQLFGLSTQTTDYQQELVERIHLPYELLSDAELELTHALRLPTFEFDSMTLIKRLTIVVHNGVIEHVFYPVHTPDKHPQEVIEWLVASGR